MTTKETVLNLYQTGRTPAEIGKLLGLAKSTVHYHLSDDQKIKTYQRTARFRKSKPMVKKLDTFKRAIPGTQRTRTMWSNRKSLTNKALVFQKTIRKMNGRNYSKALPQTFTYDDLVEHIGNDPKCYLTGRSIDLSNPDTFALDHIVPTSKNGTNSLDNLGLTCKIANQAKTNMSVAELIQFCGDVLINFGFSDGNLKDWLARQNSNLHIIE